MPLSLLLLILLALGSVGFVLGRQRAMSSAGGEIRELHSLPIYYGSNVFISALLPAVAFLIVALVVAPMYVESHVSRMITAADVRDGSSRNLVMAEVRRVADGLDNAVAIGAMPEDMARNARADFTDMTARLKDAGQIITADVTVNVLKAAQEYRASTKRIHTIVIVVTILLALAGFAYGYMRTHKDFRARNTVEKALLAILIVAASIAVLTTVGIILSLAFNTIDFFRLYPWQQYLFGTTWQPKSGGGVNQPLGLIPLLWGTMYISFIALLVAVPIGLFAAIYLSEYASRRVRGIVKPALEVLAGIPSIVYGLFALLTVGPTLMKVFGPGALGWMGGASSVMTAGLVMGIMLIPFVSSLSDDIINAVPQAMRDGSYGLGATQSETIRQVILPAALPGIVGAIILAASRAIGETMLVVFGAGAAGRLSLNPFEAMTTVTAKIVSQLTGDADFTAPEVLVAYALGTTLFVVTLILNYIAQHIVAKYREQYT
ncbi:MAG: phosphate ABC transporter permease subunit PstC [Rhodobacteraceae bacterium]|nr:phosphate ABC transporter permease subunit PstC [Paracoccaceae bacterium]QEW20529.1 Phosphate transport system permease protein PstC [Marinibacterium anthonyi]